MFYDCFSRNLVLNVLLMFHQIPGTCAYKIVLMNRVFSKVLYDQSIPICLACLFWSTIEEILKLINISNKEWLALLEKIFFFTKRQEFPTFLRYVLYSMPTTLLQILSATYFFGCLLRNTIRRSRKSSKSPV